MGRLLHNMLKSKRMKKSEQIAHLCRRLGFGITAEDRQRYQTMSLAAITDELLDFDKPSTFPFHPLEAFWDKDKQFQNQPPRVAAWWALRMAFSNQPARDKLLLFLHDHFAVSSEKVENAFLMLIYLQTLEQHLNKPFHELLSSMTADPAMMVWLDLTTNIRGRPNENYAREFLELFTLGIDSGYTEKDIHELARVFTGWSIRIGIDGTTLESRRTQLLDSIRNNWSIVAGSFAEALHDPGPYTILGKTDKFSAESVSLVIAQDPRTARHLATKLLEFYVYPNPEPKTVEKFAQTFIQTQGNLNKMLRAIATSEEFWSDRAQRAIVKCPLDYVVPMIRQLVPAEQVLSLRDKDTSIETPIPDAVLAIGSTIIALTNRMGMLPLYPPDVAGWNWGTRWITSASMIDRMNLGTVFTNQGRGRSASTKLNTIAIQRGLKTNEELVLALLEIFDTPSDANSIKVLNEAAKSQNLAAAIGNLDATSTALRPILKALFATPAFQFM